MRLDPEKVRRARERLGYSIEITGEQGDLSPNSVLRAEHGEEIRPSTARRLARALNTEVADLYPKAEAPPSSPVVEREPERELERRTRKLLQDRREYTTTIRALKEKLSREFEEQKATPDITALSYLEAEVTWTLFGADQSIEEDKDVQERADETIEEMEAWSEVQKAMWELADLSIAIENELKVMAEGSLEDTEGIPSSVARIAEARARREQRRRAS